MTDQWATYADAASLVGVPVNTLRVWVHRGRKGKSRHIETRTIHRQVYVHLADVRHAERDSRQRADLV